MDIMKILRLSLLIVLSAFIFACSVEEPEGPGEQIGKGLDLITKGLEDLDKGDKALTRSEREELERKREEERQSWDRYKDKERDLGHDPYYDTPPGDYDSKAPSGDSNSNRRY